MFSFLFFAVTIYFGLMVVKRLQLRLFPFEQLIYGTTIGVVTAAYLGLLIAYMAGFTLTSQLILTLLLLAAALLFQYKAKRREVHEPLPAAADRPIKWLLIITTFILAYIGSTTLTEQKTGELWINNSNNYGDIRLHLAYINNFVSGQNIPVENPIFSGTSPSYPFLINFFTAQLVLFGISVTAAINFISIILLLTLAGSLYVLAFRLTNRHTIASLAPFLLITSGGIGFFTMFVPEWAASGFSLQFLTHTPHDYSLLHERGYVFGNTITTFFNPQRGFLLGFPLVALILTEFFKLNSHSTRGNYTFIGILIATLVLAHTSSLLILALLTPFFLVRTARNFSSNRDYMVHWLWLIVPAGIITLFLLKIFISQADSLLSYIRLQDRWISDGGPFLLFWFKNAGIALVTSIVALLITHKHTMPWRSFVIYSFILFFFANIVITQPWEFDNSKYLIYWYAILCILIAYAIVYIAQKSYLVLAVLLGFSLSITGLVDILRRMQPSQNWYPIVSAIELQQVRMIQHVIPPQSRVLTIGDKLDPITPHLGRRLIYGDDAWLWSHGIKGYKDRLADVHTIYRGEQEAVDLINQYGIDYVIISEKEREREINLNEAFFRIHYERIYTDATNSQVYRISAP